MTTDYEVLLDVRTDDYGDEYYEATPMFPVDVDLSAATFKILHPETDDGKAVMQIKLADMDSRYDEDCLAEVSLAEKHFEGTGYVGYVYFLTSWQGESRYFPRGKYKRKPILERLITAGKVELYQSEDGREAIRSLV